MTTENVAILGASSNPGRYSCRAFQLLKAAGHRIFPVATRETDIEGIPAFRRLIDIPEHLDTITVYLNPANLADCVNDIIAAQPDRVIFNPGSEDPTVMADLRARGIQVEMACTLILLRTGQF